MPADRPETCPMCGSNDPRVRYCGSAEHATVHPVDSTQHESRCAYCDNREWHATPTPPAPADDAGDAERDNSIYDDAAEYLAERDAMIAEREAHRAVVDAARAVLATRYRDGWGWFVAMDDRDEYAKWNGLRAAIADLRGTKGLR